MSNNVCLNENHECHKCRETSKWYGGADVCIHNRDCIHNHNDILKVITLESMKKELPSIIKKPCRFQPLGYSRSIYIVKKEDEKS